MRIWGKILFISFAYLINNSLFAQISSNAGFSEKTFYSPLDSVHVFCTESTTGGSLFATDSSNHGGYTFQWFKYDPLANAFNIPLSGFIYNSDSTRTDISSLESGGYKVILTKPDTTQEYIAWIYNNVNLSLDLQVFDPLDCELLEFYGNPNFITGLTIYNYTTGEGRTLPNSKKSYTWEFESEGEVNIPTYDFSYTSTAILPLEETKCKLTLVDRFGCTVVDSVVYTAIATKAEFTMTQLDDNGIEISSSDTELSDQAPMNVRFTNKSKRGADFVWFFGDSLVKKDKDYIYTSDFNLQPEHTYFFTKKDGGYTYTAKLTSTSSYGCKDSVTATITLDPSEIEFPNVFSQNNDGINDVFIVDQEKFKSIRTFKISVFNRTGQLMHEYEGEIRKWKGWDGSVRGRGEASEGTYFFVIEVTGWDGVTYNNKKLNSKGNSYFGFIGLYRDK